MSSSPSALPFVDRRRHRWLRRAWRWAFGTLFVCWSLLLIAWLTLQWGILPRVGQWRPQIEARASAALGVPVAIGAIRVRSGGWMPALELDDVVLHDAQRREALRLPKVQAALSARSFIGLQLRFEQLLIDGATLDVRRDAAGRLFVGGLAVDGGRAAGEDNAAADWLFAQHEFAVRGARVRWIDEQRASDAPLELAGVDFVIRNGLVSHDLRLDATPPADWGERFTLAGRFTQPLWAARSDWRRWSGSAHASLPRARARLLREAGVELPFAVDGGEGALRAWVEWQGGQWRDATADVALADVTLRFAKSAEPLRFARLEGRLQAQNDDKRLRMGVAGLRFASESVVWPPTQGEVTLRHAAAVAGAASAAFTGGEVALDRIDLAALAQLAARLPLGEPLRKLLAELAPSGQVSALVARWDGSLDDPRRYQAKGNVTGLSIAAARAQEAGAVGRPGWRNASFDFDASEAGGRARLVLDRGALILPGVFEQPEIAFDTFGTRLAWKIDGPPLAPKSVEVTLAETRFANADAQGELSTATWRTGPGADFGKGGRFPGQIDLVGQLSRGRAQAVARYLPLGLPDDVRHYVERAVTGGNVASASFKVRGDLWDFPFAAVASSATSAKDGGGTFHIAARVDDVGLAYVPSEPGWSSPWPAFTRVSGELVFDRLSMEIRNAQARMWGLDLTKVNGGIRDLAQPLLRIDGQVRGPAADLLRYVNTTPVGEWTARALGGATASGAAELKLALELPLDALDRSKVQGAVVLAGNDLRLTSDSPLLAGAKARVNFTESGVQITGGSARVLGGDATIEGGTQTDGTQRFTAQGVASAEGLRRAGELGALARVAQSASGQAPYRLALAFVRGRPELTLTSPLTGLALDLPAPLKKPAEAAWPLSVTTRLAADGSARDTVKVELGSIVQAQYERDLARDAPQVLRGAIAVNDSLPPLPARGVQALLALPALDLDAWQALGERLQGSAPVGSAGALDDSYLPRTLALRAQAVTSGGRRLTQLVVGVSQDGADGAWRGNLDADQLGGYVEYRAARSAANPGRVHARLARLALPPSEASSVENLLADSPAAVPALDIVIDDFELRGKKLGRLEIEAVNRGAEGGGGRAAREWRLTRFALTNPEAQLTGSGQWQPSANAPKMVMDFKLELTDSGAFLARLGFPGTLRAGKGRLAGQLQWAGSPLALHVPSLDGKVNLTLEQGQFLKAGPGAGRLLSVLSLQSLPRRLVLDFRDLFQEGFAFDNIVGDVAIEDGVAQTNNLRMRGVQAAVLMEGSADINKETQQLRVVVVPEINAGTASLAYAAINPAVGLGTFLAQLLLRRPLIAASTREFTVQGSWAEPKVERVERKPGDPVPDIDAAPASAASAPKAAS